MIRATLIGLALVQALALVAGAAIRHPGAAATAQPPDACALTEAEPGPPSFTEGVSRQVLANVVPEALAGTEASCALRLHWVAVKAEGGAATFRYPTLISYLATGSLVFTVYDGEAQVTYRDGTLETVAGALEGSEIILLPGDVIFLEGALYTVYNETEEPAIVLNSVIERTEGPCPPCPMWP